LIGRKFSGTFDIDFAERIGKWRPCHRSGFLTIRPRSEHPQRTVLVVVQPRSKCRGRMELFVSLLCFSHFSHGAHGGTRTPNLLIRSQMLSPIGLRAQVSQVFVMAHDVQRLTGQVFRRLPRTSRTPCSEKVSENKAKQDTFTVLPLHYAPMWRTRRDSNPV
jgi:hypothetical protein